MDDKPLFIINKTAAKACRAWPIVEAKLAEEKVAFDLHQTIRPGDATNATRAALRDGVTTIAVVGGDGTLSEAAEGFFEFNSQNESPPKAINSEASPVRHPLNWLIFSQRSVSDLACTDTFAADEPSA